jgi:molecular chaperone IbpA
VEKGYLIVEGKVDKNLDSSREYDYRGVARRDFTSSFKLGENVEIRNATFSEGLLTISLEKVVPEEQKPKLITIT